MRLSSTHAEGTRRSLGNRLVLGFAGIMMALAMSVGFAGSASATSTTTAGNLPGSKSDCRQGGWKNYLNNQGKRLFKNQGQCVATVAHLPGAGYGNVCTDNSCNVDIDIDIDIIIIGNGNTVIIGFPPLG